jgi:hypothetical protein
VDKPSTGLSFIVEKIFGRLQNYQHNEPLWDLDVSGMTINCFWQHGDKDCTKFESRKPLVPKQVHVKLPFIMINFHKWYYLSCVYGLNFIEAKIPRKKFKTSDFDLHI